MIGSESEILRIISVALLMGFGFGVVQELRGALGAMRMYSLLTAGVSLFNFVFAFLLFKFAKFKSIDLKRIGIMPLRIISLIFVAYSVTTIMLFVFGVLGGQITELLWGFKLVVLVGLFASIGAGTADLIR